jgi:prepilin-type processing-associated H-X9-DG protein/prepilin-type N-terminal cleavage/methylation domain-containing protein
MNSTVKDSGLKRRRCHRGLTLIELLVVILIIAVLAVLSFFGVNRMRQAARAATCMSNVKQVGMALLMHAGENNQKLIPLQGARNKNGSRPPVWTYQLALAGYLTQWDGKGTAPCATGVWTCPECSPQSNQNYGGFGVVEGAMFVYEELSPTGVSETGSLRLSRIADPANTWLVGDAHINANSPKRGWYAIWPQPSKWNDHGPAVGRHGGKANVCMVDGHVESLTLKEIEDRELTVDVTK